MEAERVESCDLRELLRAVWCRPDTPVPPDSFLNHALLATSCFSESSEGSYYPSFLREMLRLFKAERGFLFGIRNEKDGSVEILQSIASMDVDGDQISNPEKKAPVETVLVSAQERVPVCYLRTDDESEKDRSLLVLPACSRETTHSVVVLENQFRDLQVDEDSLSTALIYCRCLAGQQDLASVAAENQSLWKDLTRMRDEVGAATNLAATPIPKRASKPIQREGLKGDYSMIVGSSLKMLDILQVIDRISGSTAPVLINGESGTGKELAALAVHRNSPRKDQTFVSENCGAITETLLESELFGYVKGAFTGANKDHKGLFELATGGTLFLDEVGDMSLSMQKKLLRVLQEGVIRRVGAKDFTSVDVRIISATNKDLLEECRNGNFREDLYYRLNVINLVLPPLRERKEDIEDLVDFFLSDTAPTPDERKTIDPNALQVMSQYPWPGNIRELQNEVRKIATLCDGDVIGVHDLSENLRSGDSGQIGGHDWTSGFAHMTLKEATEHLERALIQQALDNSGGNKSLVAKTLQIPKTSLYNKIHKYDL